MKKEKNIKKFFKPNTVKILITIIILVLAHLHYIGYFSIRGIGGAECVGCEPQDIWINNPIFWLPYYFIGGGVGDFNPVEAHLYLLKEKPGIALFMFFLIIFYWYILSCIIFKIYSRLKKKQIARSKK